MFEYAHDTLHKGAVGLARAIFEYQRAGYTVLLPLVDAQDYDLVIEKDNNFKKVQCKATAQLSKDKKRYVAGLRSVKTNTKETKTKNKGDFDLLFVLCENGDCYSMPTDAIPETAVELGDKYKQYKLEGIRMERNLIGNQVG